MDLNKDIDNLIKVSQCLNEDRTTLGATDKPCGVRTVANPKLLLNGT